MEHTYRYDTSSFDGVYEEGGAPQKMIVDQIYEVGTRRTTWLVNGGLTPTWWPYKDLWSEKIKHLVHVGILEGKHTCIICLCTLVVEYNQTIE